MKKETADIVYHYCSLETFLSIIQNASLWVSDISKSNDYLECVYIRDKIRDRIEYRLKDNPEYLHAWRTGYGMNEELNEELNDSMLTYVICFSEKKDFLSQWRGYADDGKGIAIGFCKKMLETLPKIVHYNLDFVKVIYDEKRQEKYIDRVVEENLNKMETKGIGHVGLELNTNYKSQFAIYKNPSFKEEEEWRLIFNSYPNGKEIKAGNMMFKKPKFRVSKEKLISYVELDFSDIKREFIKEIWIGPKSEVELRDIMQVLLKYEYYDKEEGYNTNYPILITKSLSSYR